MNHYYIFLAIAITAELSGTTLLKFSDGFTKPLFSALAVVSYVICYYSFAKSMQGINLSAAYATWCALGIVVATLLSVYLFKESINIIGIISIIFIVIGILALNLFGMKS